MHKTSCTQMFRVALLTVTKSKNKHPPPDEWINRMWSFHKEDGHSALKSNEASRAMTWRSLKKHDVEWKKTDMDVWVHLYEMSRTGKSTETEGGLAVAGGCGRRDGKWPLISTGFLFEVMEVFQSWIVVMVAQLCEHTKNLWTVHFKRVTFTVCEYLNLKKDKLICRAGIETQI